MKIVFVHYGQNIPPYLKQNIKVSTEDFPLADVVLITDSNLSGRDMPGVSIFKSIFDLSLIPTLETLKHPKNFRDNFWFKSIYRFYALREYMDVNPGEIFHIESDVRLSRDFPFQKFLENDLNIAYPLVDGERGIASILFIRDVSSLDHFLSEINSYMSHNFSETDMTLLGKYFLSHPKRVLILPIGPYEMMRFGEKVSPESWQSTSFKNIEYFGGYFDGFYFGQYYFGTDSRNSYGFSYLKSKAQAAPIKSVKLEWVKPRNFPYVRGSDSLLPLYCIHFHNKSVRMISSSKIHMSYMIKFSLGNIRFNPRIFYSLVLKKITKIIKRVN